MPLMQLSPPLPLPRTPAGWSMLLAIILSAALAAGGLPSLRVLCLVPLAGGAADVIENGLALYLLAQYPRQLQRLAPFLLRVGVYKWQLVSGGCWLLRLQARP